MEGARTEADDRRHWLEPGGKTVGKETSDQHLDMCKKAEKI